MKRSPLLVAAASLAFIACGPAQVVVSAEVESQDPNTGEMVVVPVSDLEVQLIPFDRDQLFDSMAVAYGVPEPEIPQDLVDAREEIRLAQEEWRSMEDRWNLLRDTLQKITEAMEPLNRGESQYRMLFNDYNDFEDEYVQIENEKDAAFARFDSLQKANLEYAQEIKISIQNWEADAFAELDPIWIAKVREVGRPEVADTTDASGVAVMEAPEGEYWVYARLEEVYNELYWNIPVSVTGGEPTTVTLTRDNAEVRPKL